jgi:hypothetical protein
MVKLGSGRFRAEKPKGEQKSPSGFTAKESKTQRTARLLNEASKSPTTV